MNNYFSPRVPTKDNFLLNRNQRSATERTQSLLPSSEFNFSVVDTTDDLNSLENSLEDKDFKMKMVSFIYIKI